MKDKRLAEVGGQVRARTRKALECLLYDAIFIFFFRDCCCIVFSLLFGARQKVTINYSISEFSIFKLRSWQVSWSWPMYGPKCSVGSAIVISRWGSRISSSARSGARWFKTVGVIISCKRSFLRSSFLIIQNLKTTELLEAVGWARPWALDVSVEWCTV